jgi:hypothetical protein
MTFTEITFTNIKNEVSAYLRDRHNKAAILFSPASPYGQILDVLQNLHQLSFLYLKNSINQFEFIEVINHNLSLTNNINGYYLIENRNRNRNRIKK